MLWPLLFRRQARPEEVFIVTAVSPIVVNRALVMAIVILTLTIMATRKFPAAKHPMEIMMAIAVKTVEVAEV